MKVSTTPRERPVKERRILTIISEEWIKFVIKTITPIILNMIYNWYVNQKKKGKISIQTAEGTIVKLDAESVKKFEFIEKKPKKKQSKKRGITHRTRSSHN